jgi:hypothetical protein
MSKKTEPPPKYRIWYITWNYVHGLHAKLAGEFTREQESEMKTLFFALKKNKELIVCIENANNIIADPNNPDSVPLPYILNVSSAQVQSGKERKGRKK